MAKKKTLGTALAVGVTIGLLLLVVAGDYYSVGVVTAAAAHDGSTETTLDLSCYTSEGTFNGWSCDNAHGSYVDG